MQNIKEICILCILLTAAYIACFFCKIESNINIKVTFRDRDRFCHLLLINYNIIYDTINIYTYLCRSRASYYQRPGSTHFSHVLFARPIFFLFWFSTLSLLPARRKIKFLYGPGNKVFFFTAFYVLLFTFKSKLIVKKKYVTIQKSYANII